MFRKVRWKWLYPMLNKIQVTYNCAQWTNTTYILPGVQSSIFSCLNQYLCIEYFVLYIYIYIISRDVIWVTKHFKANSIDLILSMLNKKWDSQYFQQYIKFCVLRQRTRVERISLLHWKKDWKQQKQKREGEKEKVKDGENCEYSYTIKIH